uniref:Uncharacterized protein n=1 Tax=Romanomermis culicivorax TaxID=13658 RepID=A0A915JXU1_ROMCU
MQQLGECDNWVNNRWTKDNWVTTTIRVPNLILALMLTGQIELKTHMESTKAAKRAGHIDEIPHRLINERNDYLLRIYDSDSDSDSDSTSLTSRFGFEFELGSLAQNFRPNPNPFLI